MPSRCAFHAASRCKSCFDMKSFGTKKSFMVLCNNSSQPFLSLGLEAFKNKCLKAFLLKLAFPASPGASVGPGVIGKARLLEVSLYACE